MSNVQTFKFQSRFSANRVDKANGVIRGVSLITGNVEAIGHDLHVDDTTVSQVLGCAGLADKIPVKLNHGSGVENLCGYIDGASCYLDNGKLRGDWYLLKTHGEYDKLMEGAERMPECFGMSIAFKGKGEAVKGGRKAARCEKLLAVDCVTQPAANPEGLFSARVDTPQTRMDPNQSNTGEPTLADVLQALKEQGETMAQISQRLAATEAFQKSVQDHLENDNLPTLEELDGMTDEELDALGLTRAEVDQAIADATGGGGDGTGGVERDGSDAMAGAGAGGEATGLAAKAMAEIRQFRAQMAAAARREEADQVEYAFSVVEEKVTTLAERNEELTKQLAAKDAEIKALRLTVKTGARNVPASVEGVTLFSAKSAQSGSFEQLVTVKFEELKAKSGATELSAKSKAIDFVIRQHPVAYREYRERGGKIELGSAS